MPCNPNNSLNPPIFPNFPIPGFGLPIAPIQLPIPDFNFPENFPQSILDLINSLTINWAGSRLSPQLDDLTNSILKALSDLFSQIAPFLSLYNFFQALLNMILCIIEVLLCIPNPWAMIRAMRKLIKRCLPAFLNLFPWLALLAMILSILLLLLALIQYIIARILQIIEDLLKNLVLLGQGATLQDAESTAAVAIKIASLLCIMENLMAVFSAIAAILAIINALASIRGRKISCGNNDSGNDPDCCNDVCPPFIQNNPDGISGIQGTLRYYKQIQADPIDGEFFTRAESWQFVNDASVQPYPFKDIITPLPDSNGELGDIFWPEGQVFPANTTLRKAPYKVDLTLENYNPIVFIPSDTGIARNFTIKNTIVEIKPYIGVRDEDNNIDTSINNDGTLSLVGGLVYEANGLPYMIGGQQATLETFIHQNPSTSGEAPVFDDGYVINDIPFTLIINHAALVNYNLTTIGCIPEISTEVGIINNTTKIDSVLEQVPDALPDVAGAQQCVANAIASIRQDVSLENVAARAADIEACLRDLETQTTNSFCSVFELAVDPFQSEVTLDPDIQFVTRPIEVFVDLKDVGGIDISTNIPIECQSTIASKIKGNVTFGDITDFSYDGYGHFVADITSDVAGSGELTVSFNGNVFSRIINRDDIEAQTEIQEIVLPYQFIGTNIVDPKNRRDATDVASSE